MAWDAVTVDRGSADWLFSAVDLSDMVHKRLHGIHDHLGFGINALDLIQGLRKDG